MDPPVVLPPTIDERELPPPGAALAEALDRLLLVQLRDGRKVLGTLISFDQFANLVLQDARERIIVGAQYAEVPLGLHIVRGENVVLLGEVDPELEPPPGLSAVSEPEIRAAQRAEKEAEKMQGLLRSRLDFLDDLI